MHEFDDALVARPFEPLVSWDHVGVTADIKVDVWDGLLLRGCAITTGESVW